MQGLLDPFAYPTDVFPTAAGKSYFSQPNLAYESKVAATTLSRQKVFLFSVCFTLLLWVDFSSLCSTNHEKLYACFMAFMLRLCSDFPKINAKFYASIMKKCVCPTLPEP